MQIHSVFILLLIGIKGSVSGEETKGEEYGFKITAESKETNNRIQRQVPFR
jgi:hypothetical protein